MTNHTILCISEGGCLDCLIDVCLWLCCTNIGAVNEDISNENVQMDSNRNQQTQGYRNRYNLINCGLPKKEELLCVLKKGRSSNSCKGLVN